MPQKSIKGKKLVAKSSKKAKKVKTVAQNDKK